MNSVVTFIVKFENKSYTLNHDQVDELLKISKYCYPLEPPKGYSPIELTITLKNKQVITGYILNYDGFNPLYPYDVNIPLRFTIKQGDKETSITFLEVEKIDVED